MLTKEQEEHVDRLDAAFNKMRSQLDWLVEMTKRQSSAIDFIGSTVADIGNRLFDENSDYRCNQSQDSNNQSNN